MRKKPTYDELIDLVSELRSEIKELRQEVKELKQENAELKSRLAKYEKKDSSNSSKPPSKDNDGKRKIKAAELNQERKPVPQKDIKVMHESKFQTQIKLKDAKPKSVQSAVKI